MLRNIIADLQDAIGVSADRARLLRFVNQAYREYYERTDLHGSLFEQSFEFHPEEQLVTLPWYVDQVRGMRRVQSNDTVRLTDLTPRMVARPWRQVRNEFHVVARRAIHTPLALESQLTFTIATAQTQPFTVTVKGQTGAAATLTETLTFAAGETAKTTTAQFIKDDPHGIESLSRNGAVTADITVTDGAGTVLATIPNSLESVAHVVVQWHDMDSYDTSDDIIEVFYKRVFTPLTLDTDECCFPALENAITWKARAYYYSLSKDELAGQQALLAEQKADALYRQATNTRDLETVKIATVARNPYEEAWRPWRRY